MDDIGAELIIHVNRETQLQTIKGRCQQLNPNKILIRIWSCSVRQKSACECVNAQALSVETPPPPQKLSQNHLLSVQSLWWQGCLYLSGVNKCNCGWQWHLAPVCSPPWQHVCAGPLPSDAASSSLDPEVSGCSSKMSDLNSPAAAVGREPHFITQC